MEPNPFLFAPELLPGSQDPELISDYDAMIGGSWALRAAGDTEGAEQLLREAGREPEGITDGK